MANFPIADLEKNKTETLSRTPCAFVLSDGGTAGRPRFCGAPAAPSSAYCRRHRRLCQVEAGSAAAGRVIRAFEHEAGRAAILPAELAYLSSVAVPKLDSADEPHDLAGCIDLVPPRDRIDE